MQNYNSSKLCSDLVHGIAGHISVSGLKIVQGGNIHQIKAYTKGNWKNHVTKPGAVDNVLQWLHGLTYSPLIK